MDTPDITIDVIVNGSKEKTFVIPDINDDWCFETNWENQTQDIYNVAVGTDKRNMLISCFGPIF